MSVMVNDSLKANPRIVNYVTCDTKSIILHRKEKISYNDEQHTTKQKIKNTINFPEKMEASFYLKIQAIRFMKTYFWRHVLSEYLYELLKSML